MTASPSASPSASPDAWLTGSHEGSECTETAGMDLSNKKVPWRRNDDRIILHFDYDCFYAQVVENQQPALKSLPLGIKQKSILATCNYEARRRGVKKLMLISEAKKVCPELVLADGEDLSAFRDVSKKLYALLRGYSWNKKAERLGLDEIFLDVTDLISYNLPLLNRNALPGSFFCLSAEDPELGFSFDASSIAGQVAGHSRGQDSTDNSLYVKLLLASHLARYLRLKIEEQGYTSACGISTSKLLAKLVGGCNKPRNQTTLLSMGEGEVMSFMDSHGLRQVPGIGSKTAHALESHVLGRDPGADTHTTDSVVTVGQLRARPGVSPQLLEKLLGRPGFEKGIGHKVWALLHGVDDSEVKAASNVPTQISIEDTYQGLNTPAEVERELLKLTASLIKRMHVDLLEDEEEDEGSSDRLDCPNVHSHPPGCRQKWIAHPKTLRLSTRPKTSPGDNTPYNFNRTSRSQPLPTFVFSLSQDTQEIRRRLVNETLLPMFHKLNPHKNEWHIGLINICVANMSLTGSDDTAGSGRDIAAMFRRQDTVLREFRTYEPPESQQLGARVPPLQPQTEHMPLAREEQNSAEEADPDLDDASEPDESWDQEEGSLVCARCGHFIPMFAAAAHKRYHALGDEE